MPASSLSALAALALATTQGGAHGGSRSEAERYLRLCLGRSFGRTIYALLDQRDPTSDKGRVRARIVRDAAGRIRTSIVEPESLRGYEVLDDGRELSILMAKDKLVMIQESAAVAEGNLDFRVGLVRKNYRLSVKPGPKTLDRPTVVLTATARWRGISSRRYLLDAATGYPFRHDIVDASGTENLFNVVSVRYASSSPRDFFRPFPTAGRQVIRYAPGGALKPGEALRRVGLEPQIPKEIPFGFRVTHVEIKDSPDWRAVVVRVSDGLVVSSVYVWLTNPDIVIPNTSVRTVESRRGRSVMVIDGPAVVRARLVDAFHDAMR